MHRVNVLEIKGPTWRGKSGWQQATYHGKAHICLLEGWPVVSAIPCHGHHLPLLAGAAVYNPWNTEQGWSHLWPGVIALGAAGGWLALVILWDCNCAHCLQPSIPQPTIQWHDTR